MNMSIYTKPECDFFRENCNFTDEEAAVFDLRIRNLSIVQICLQLGMAEATVYRRLKSIKYKIHRVLIEN